MIRYLGVGTSRLSRGRRLRVLALVESAGPNAPIIPKAPVLRLNGETISREFKCSLQTTLNDAPGVQIGSFIAEIETSELPIGAYELQFAFDHEKVTLDELVWIVSPNDVAALVDEETLGQDPDSRYALLNSEPRASEQTVRRVVESAVREKLTGFLRLGNRLTVSPPIETSFSHVPSLSLDLMAYLADIFGDQCRNFLIHGAQDCALGLAFDERQCRLSMTAGLDALTSASEADLESPELPFLRDFLRVNVSGLELISSTRVLQGRAYSSLELRRGQKTVAAS